MSSPTLTPTILIPEQKKLIFALETVAAGTPGTTNIIQEPCQDIVPSEQHTPIRIEAYTGTASQLLGILPGMKYVQLTITLQARVNGLFGVALAAICGNGADTKSGAGDPYTHTVIPNPHSTLMNTVTIWEFTGDPTNINQYVRGTIQSVAFRHSPTAVATAEIVIWAITAAPVAIASVTPTIYVGGGGIQATPVLGHQGTFTYQSSLAGTPYPATVMGGDFTIARDLEAQPSSSNISPQDFTPGPIMHTGSFTMLFDGIGGHTAYADWLALATTGNASNLNSYKFTDSDTHSFQVDYEPMTISGYQADDSGRARKMTINYEASDDVAQVNAATPVLSKVKQITIKNALSFVLAN